MGEGDRRREIGVRPAQYSTREQTRRLIDLLMDALTKAAADC
ncbi:hypothetical protein [Streptomyces malaysiensis]